VKNATTYSTGPLAGIKPAALRFLCSALTKAKKICGFPVSRPYLAFGRRNPDTKLFYSIMFVSVST
jgi:hypothetical protein